MPVISFANAKGGAGKTTAALLLATEVADRGKSVTIFDADPQKWISHWADLPGRPAKIDVVSQITPASITEQILDAGEKADYVIVDLEGTENLVVANALSVSDLVVVPIQGSSMDARGGAKILSLIAKLEKVVKHDIRHCVALTRTNAAVTTRALKAVQEFLSVKGIDVLMTPIVERAAYRDLFEFGGGLKAQDPKTITNLEKA
ncbi:MAG: ParA family protein, partial [Roseibium sp.]